MTLRYRSKDGDSTPAKKFLELLALVLKLMVARDTRALSGELAVGEFQKLLFM